MVAHGVRVLKTGEYEITLGTSLTAPEKRTPRTAEELAAEKLAERRRFLRHSLGRTPTEAELKRLP